MLFCSLVHLMQGFRLQVPKVFGNANIRVLGIMTKLIVGSSSYYFEYSWASS